MPEYTFPPGFVWGAATSAYQIEGAAAEDGRGESIWDRMAHTDGRVIDGTSGDVACDHYHRWPDDLRLMGQLGLQAYRFSVAWPRIIPQGRGAINQAGLDFYDRLIDGLLAAGITPYLTLYHWDLPQPLQEEGGGWAARSTAEAFAAYAEVVSRAYGDRVKHWITHNEPWCAAFLGYQVGEHAPGIKGDWYAALRASHHLLLSHGWAVERIRAASPGAEVGIALNQEPAFPATPSPEDYHAARIYDGYYSRWFLDPVYGRGYPADMVEHYSQQGYLPDGMRFVLPGDLEAIATPLDFLGVNYYTRAVRSAAGSYDNAPSPDGSSALTEMGWEVFPEGLYQLLTRIAFTYRPAKLYVTENGASFSDGPDEAGRIPDGRRIGYLRGHLQACARAIESGVPLAGYFVWSLLDNFEWAKGYTQRFGVVWVDFETQQRLPKDSALWYRQCIEANAVID